MKSVDTDLKLRSVFGILGIGVIVGVAVGVSVLAKIEVSQGSPVEIGMTYADLAATSLTAVAVIMTALTLMAGLYLFFGQREIKNEAREEAQKTAEERIKKFLGVDGQPSDEVREILIKRVDEIIWSEDFRNLVEERVTMIALNETDKRETNQINNDPEWGDEDSEFGDGNEFEEHQTDG